jgi:aryl-alcohol dehydrogenase-like predicted oxidoreductase
MKYRMLGRTGLYVSEICFGTMTFGGKGFWTAIGTLDQGAVNGLIKKSLDAGINFFDTANVYSEGESEKLFGQALKDLGVARNDLVVATKVRGRMGPGPNQVGLSRGHIMNAVEDSLRRLGTDHIDLYQVHGADLVTPIDETLRALDDLVRQGKVRYIGCSNMMAWQIMKSLGLSEAKDWARFESVQAYYSLAGRDLEREIVPLVEAEQVGIMVWSPLAGGFLSGKFQREGAGPNDARRVTFDFPPVDKEKAFGILDVVRPIAAAHNVSVARVNLAWILTRSFVTTIIIGAKTPEQAEDNIAAADLVLTQDEIEAIDKASALVPEYPGWMVTRQHAGRLPGSPLAPIAAQTPAPKAVAGGRR